MTLVPALRCVKRQIVNTFFTLMSVGKRRHSTKCWSWKKFNSCVGSVNVCSVGPIRIVYFRVITRHCKIIPAPVRTFVAMDEEKLIKAVRSFPSLLKVTMKCYKHVMLKKMLEKKWRSVELSICRKWASRSARRISCNRLYSPCFLRRENIGRTHMLLSFFRRRRSAISKSNSNSSSLPELWSIVNNTC